MINIKKRRKKMTDYKDLNEGEKKLFVTIDSLYMNNNGIERKSFIKVLALLINKFKYKKEHKGNK